MATAKSFEELVKEAPSTGTVSLVGALSQSSEAGKFVLTVQDGSALTLAIAAVKGHAELGNGMVRVDLDATNMPSVNLAAAGGGAAPFALATPHQATVVPLGPIGHTSFWLDNNFTHPIVDSGATGNPRIPFSWD